jgi:uncharacterized protein
MKVKNVALSEQTIANEIPAFCQKWKICEFSLFCPALPVAWEAGDSEVSSAPDSRIGVLVTFEADLHPTICDLVQMRDELTSLLGQTVCLLPKESIEQSENYIRRQQILDTAIVVYDSGCCRLTAPPELINPLTPAEQDQALLLDVLIACRRIQRYTSDICWEQFQQCDCTLLQDATVRQLECIGETIKHISQSTKTQHPESPWSLIINVCECLACEDNQAEAETIWQAVQQGVPRLICYIEPFVFPGVPVHRSSDYGSSSLVSEPV